MRARTRTSSGPAAVAAAAISASTRRSRCRAFRWTTSPSSRCAGSRRPRPSRRLLLASLGAGPDGLGCRVSLAVTPEARARRRRGCRDQPSRPAQGNAGRGRRPARAGDPDGASRSREDRPAASLTGRARRCSPSPVRPNSTRSGRATARARSRKRCSSTAFDWLRRWPGPAGSADLRFFQVGGKIKAVAPDATAYVHRGYDWLAVIGLSWEAADDPSAPAKSRLAGRILYGGPPLCPGRRLPEFRRPLACRLERRRITAITSLVSARSRPRSIPISSSAFPRRSRRRRPEKPGSFKPCSRGIDAMRRLRERWFVTISWQSRRRRPSVRSRGVADDRFPGAACWSLAYRGALVALVVDGAKSIAASGLTVTPLGLTWYSISPSTLIAAQTFRAAEDRGLCRPLAVGSDHPVDPADADLAGARRARGLARLCRPQAASRPAYALTALARAPRSDRFVTQQEEPGEPPEMETIP